MISDPWYSPANATISSITMNAISELSSRSIADFAGPISTGVAYEKTYVPQDYALSFNITLTGVVMGKSSIIHYTSENSELAERMPGKFFNISYNPIMSSCLTPLQPSFLFKIRQQTRQSYCSWSLQI